MRANPRTPTVSPSNSKSTSRAPFSRFSSPTRSTGPFGGSGICDRYRGAREARRSRIGRPAAPSDGTAGAFHAIATPRSQASASASKPTRIACRAATRP
eukprot:CAMPEP_0118887076 /NCGR_PEP_ID=MMETSP1163-20130328/24923_1 /TAXON_ID=124430 /ORGANISM="Phaeomonas parva, Strain CCMP2877" /LENGTH=98 /DNA_ID=CAMNT_0006825429 /DNA_START=89 /DNA_END=385 /DNA_ORIENTATION=+